MAEHATSLMAKAKAKVVFGLTGGVASGKSTVSARFRERGVPVIDADEVARAVVAARSEGLARVVAAFGSEVLLPGGALDRPKLGRLVFADDAKRRQLEAIVHPLIVAETRLRTEALFAGGHELVCYDASLLVERGLADAFRPLVVVALPPELQRERLMRRDGLAADEADLRIAAQHSLAAKCAVADYILENRGSIEELRRAADGVLEAIARGAGVVLAGEGAEPEVAGEGPPA